MWGGGGCIVLNIIKEINNCGDLRGSGNECEGPYTLSTFHITLYLLKIRQPSQYRFALM